MKSDASTNKAIPLLVKIYFFGWRFHPTNGKRTSIHFLSRRRVDQNIRIRHDWQSDILQFRAVRQL